MDDHSSFFRGGVFLDRHAEGEDMDPVTIAILGLACLLAITVVWRMYQQRGDFVSKKRYVARNIGTLMLLVAAALVFAHTRFGYPGQFLVAGAAVAWVAVALVFWGNRGYRPKSKVDSAAG